MKDFLKVSAAAIGLTVACIVVAVGCGEMIAHLHNRNYFVRIECSNCKDFIARSRIPRGEPVPPEPLKCDECGNMTGKMKR